MIYRNIIPDDGYCLYFPNRQKGQRFEAGRRVRVWLLEEWKHIKLGQFEVKFSTKDDQVKQEKADLITTAESLECKVRADFKLVIGGAKEGIEERLERATITCPPTRNIRKKIELEFFQKWATNYCKNSIKRIIRECKFINLIEDADYRAKAEARISDDLKKNLETIGLILVESTVLVEPLEPEGELATKQILEKWLEVHRTLDEAARARKQAENEHEQLLAILNRDHANVIMLIEQQKKQQAAEAEATTRIKKLEVEMKADIEEKKQIRDKEEEIRQIQEQINAWSQEALLQKIRRESSVAEEQIKEDQRIAQIKQQNENQHLKDKLEMLELEKAAIQKEIEILEAKERITKTETELELIQGSAKAEIIEKEILAKSADIILMRKELMIALPRILEEASRPIAKMGEIRILNLTGAGETGEQKNVLGGILSSASMLPFIKEVMRFLRDLEPETKEVQVMPEGDVTKAKAVNRG